METNIPQMRTCSECGKNKPLNLIFFEAVGKIYFKHRCRKCKARMETRRNAGKINNDYSYYLKHVLSVRIHQALKPFGGKQGQRTMDIIGCSRSFLKSHIESQFTKGMSWENRGSWHIDHIVPIASAGKDVEKIKKLNHYSNLQPLWAKDNLSKSSKVSPEYKNDNFVW